MSNIHLLLLSPVVGNCSFFNIYIFIYIYIFMYFCFFSFYVCSSVCASLCAECTTRVSWGPWESETAETRPRGIWVWRMRQWWGTCGDKWREEKTWHSDERKKKKRVRDEKVKKQKNEGIREENIETIIKRKSFLGSWLVGQLTCWEKSMETSCALVLHTDANIP